MARYCFYFHGIYYLVVGDRLLKEDKMIKQWLHNNVLASTQKDMFSIFYDGGNKD